jgi:hypothetical protein
MTEHERNPLFHVNPNLFPILQIKLLANRLPLLPPQIPLARLRTTLDAGCGLHHWGKALLHAMTEEAGKELLEGVCIDGIECNGAVVSHARSQIRAFRGYLHIAHADLFDLPPQAYERYDLVHARFLSPYVAPAAWPRLLAQLAWATKAGGWVVWTEPALPTPFARVPAWQQWLSWIAQMVEQFGGSPAISSQMETLFGNTGSWEQIAYSSTDIPLGFSPYVQGYVPAEQMDLIRSYLSSLSPLIVEAGIATPAQVNMTLSQLLQAFASRQLSSTWRWVTVFGQKAAPASQGRSGIQRGGKG